VRTITCPPGRGGQVRAGIEVFNTDAVLVLHADCALAPGTAERILAALNACPEALGGAAGMRFSGKGAGTLLVAGLNALRLRVAGVSFGDQGQFFRREALAEAGGFPGARLMEDVEAAFLQKRFGPVLILSGGVRASGRTWRKKGFFGNFTRIVALFTRYLAERRLGLRDPTGEAYYRRYYAAQSVPTRRS